MSDLSDRELLVYAFRESLSREKHSLAKYRAIFQATRDRELKKICAALLAASQSRIGILAKELKNFNIN